ncbi:MAG: YjjG family noncanonical pyrimidine nucleotidase [Christensenellaceae bacterium]|nr:YjjG family noncanonical pyrimidine nucleotidase [Christensenellaceae bacterium]
MVKYVFIDLDDTILDFKKAENIAIKRTLSKLGIPVSEELCACYSNINMLLWKSLERGEVTRDELRVIRFSRFFEKIGADVSAEVGARTYEGFLSEGHFFIDGAEQLIKELSQIYDLYLASNGITATQRGRIASADIKKYFKNIFISEDIGFSKPDKRYFDACFNMIEGFEPEKAVIIGDSLTSDILGGKNAGIRTIWYAPHGNDDPLPDRTVLSLKDIPGVLKEL